MAKSLPNFATFVALLCLYFLLLSSHEVQMVEAKVCEERSKTWSGGVETGATVTNNVRIGRKQRMALAM
ncbi:unnamed protein product [Prunus armeniaca]|uniref:Transmembrane protein n=1 Tax=Prunus armeniaca TaxID=36596 RepID=A0A6J5U2V6_PRUAR|nr:hypothetical protein GBA52_007846 [Prunus armeniaca]CAB4269445.1 unnamed protein product [Prunus armeniaca]CAB4299810.1 unnamed protein product [Prunus armeniaca]